MRQNGRTGIITQARMTSTRLPGKVLLPINNKPVLQYHLERLQQSQIPVYLATTTNATDDVLITFARERKIPFYRGDEHHVLSRYYDCARQNQLDIIVRVTSDCPLIDGNLIAAAVAQYRQIQDNRLYLSNCLQRTYPRGLDFEIFSFALLEEAFQRAVQPAETEHVTPYINQNRSGNVNFEHITQRIDRSHYRITLDTPEDFALLKILIEQYQADQLSATALSDLLDKHPELVALNAQVEQKSI